MTKKALILVDLQNDFCPGGSLPAPDGDSVIPVANKIQNKFDLVAASLDWHPKNHMSFASNHQGRSVGEVTTVNGMTQILWPDHCVQNSTGSQFHPQLNTRGIHRIFHKGIDPQIDSYSTFYDNAHLRSTGLGEFLKSEGVEEVYVMGLVTEYCVKYSALDAADLGFKVFVILDGCRGVNLQTGDEEKAIEEMKSKGVKFIDSSSLQ